MKEDSGFINVWMFPEKETRTTVHLMGAFQEPLTYMSLSVVCAQYSDSSRPLSHYELVHLSTVWTVSWRK